MNMNKTKNKKILYFIVFARDANDDDDHEARRKFSSFFYVHMCRILI